LELPVSAAKPSADLEAASSATEQPTARLTLSAINHFANMVARALLQERAQLDKSLQHDAAALLQSGSDSSSWVLHRVEELLPESIIVAAAAALASLRLQALLHPHRRGLAAHCARWLGGAVLLVLGCVVIVLLLERYMSAGMAVLTHVNVATSRAFGLGGALNPSTPPQPWSIVLLLCIATTSAAGHMLLHRHGSMASLFLRLDRQAPGVLLLLASLSFALASSILFVTWIFSLFIIAGSALQQAHQRDVSSLQGALEPPP
jgi:hypothetical protein